MILILTSIKKVYGRKKNYFNKWMNIAMLAAPVNAAHGWDGRGWREER